MFAALHGVVLFHMLKLYENYRKLTLQLDNDGVATDINNSLSGLEVVSKVDSRKRQCNLIRDLLNEYSVATDVVFVSMDYYKVPHKLCVSGQRDENIKFTPCSFVTGGAEVMGGDKVFTDVSSEIHGGNDRDRLLRILMVFQEKDTISAVFSQS
ncbi:hypothetical protein OROGR_010327 [Orobanche gracilis]